ncbi:MAG: histone deacetylase [Bacteriovoracaceae bacterium]
MLIHNEIFNLNLSDYGIEIPLLDTRAEKCFNALKASPKLKNNLSKWHYTGPLEETFKEDWLLVHNKEYINRLTGKEVDQEIIKAYELVKPDGTYHRYNPKNSKFPLKNLFKNAVLHCDGTYTASRIALKSGFSYFLGGGMHHAMSSEGRGFCPLNDIVISIRKLQKDNQIRRAWIIDVDAHKGDGTAELCQKDPSIKTLSIHMKHGWPLDHTDYSAPEFIPSCIDIPIDETENELYNQKLEQGLNDLKKSGTADLCLVVNGSDPYIYDAIPSADKLQLSLTDLLKRDLLVFNFLKDLNIPQAWVMAGGYGDKVWEVHFQFLERVLG